MSVYTIPKTNLRELENYIGEPQGTLFTTMYLRLTPYVKQNQILKSAKGSEPVIEVDLNDPKPSADLLGRISVVFTVPGIRHYRNPPKGVRPHIRSEQTSEASEYPRYCERLGYGGQAYGEGYGAQAPPPPSADPYGYPQGGASCYDNPCGVPPFPPAPPCSPCGQPQPPSQPICGQPIAPCAQVGGGAGAPGYYPGGGVNIGGQAGSGLGIGVGLGGPGALPDPGCVAYAAGAPFGGQGQQPQQPYDYDGYGGGSYLGKPVQPYSQRRSPHVQLPSQQSVPGDFAYYNNSLAHLLLETVELHKNNRPLNIQYGRFLDVFDELTSKAGKSTNELVGRYSNDYDLLKASSKNKTLIARLRLWFCERAGTHLPLKAIDPAKAKMSLKIRLRNLQHCYVTSDGSVPKLVDSDSDLRPEDIGIQIRADLYFLGSREGEYIKRKNHVFLIDQIQHKQAILDPCLSSESAGYTLPIPFKGVITQFIWTLQDERHLRKKDYGNFSGIHNQDPIESYEIKVDNDPWVGPHDALWGRFMDALEYHSSTPTRHIYTHVMCRSPEDPEQVTGFIHMDGSHEYTLEIKRQVGLRKCYLDLWARGLNQLFIRDGDVELLHSPPPCPAIK